MYYLFSSSAQSKLWGRLLSIFTVSNVVTFKRNVKKTNYETFHFACNFQTLKTTAMIRLQLSTTGRKQLTLPGSVPFFLTTTFPGKILESSPPPPPPPGLPNKNSRNVYNEFWSKRIFKQDFSYSRKYNRTIFLLITESKASWKAYVYCILYIVQRNYDIGQRCCTIQSVRSIKFYWCK